VSNVAGQTKTTIYHTSVEKEKEKIKQQFVALLRAMKSLPEINQDIYNGFQKMYFRWLLI
jgi:hypothetical protein